jgi:16S rRNA (cytosine967-C5)-methyltransferase
LNDQNPRQIAARILAQRLNSSEFTENLLEIALANARLSPADRGLCHELVCGVVRWQAALDRLIERKTTPGRPQRPVLQNLLRLGLYQIFWLDRIPPHAAVHETVELAKRAGFEHQVGFLNAVLRGYLREADAIKKILADQKISQPALGYSHPEWLVEKWRQQFGDDNTRQLLEWNNRPPNTFARLNTLKTDASKLAERWREENVTSDSFSRDWLGENISFELIGHPPLATLDSFRDGWFYLQDPSTLLAPALLGAQPNETILDLCAAPGGKATFIAQQMNNTGKLIAHDLGPDRLRLIRENCKRLGVTNTDIIMPTTGIQQMLTSFDRILVDAPCSNTGVMRRRVDLRWRIQSVEIERLRTTQLELLHTAAGKLKPGGVLVYSTCSLESEENSELVRQFLAMNPSFNLEFERQLLPFVDDVDGAYVAKLRNA